MGTRGLGYCRPRMNSHRVSDPNHPQRGTGAEACEAQVSLAGLGCEAALDGDGPAAKHSRLLLQRNNDPD